MTPPPPIPHPASHLFCSGTKSKYSDTAAPEPSYRSKAAAEPVKEPSKVATPPAVKKKYCYRAHASMVIVWMKESLEGCCCFAWETPSMHTYLWKEGGSRVR